MQNAKDTFYEVLRDRLAALNPDRTIVVRGATRPAVLVDENETVNMALLENCFHLRWTAAEGETRGAYPSVALRCEVTYSTAGSAWNGGMDRGRMLAAMDADLCAAVGLCPQNAVKKSFSASPSGIATGMETKIWWSDVTFGPARVETERLIRTALVDVMSLEEGAEQ